jgi:DNA-binding transcriptional LysR family regulator
MGYSQNSDPERWSDLPFFIVVAREGSIKRAAAALGITQSAVSKRIDRVEQWLGSRAFDRSAKGTTLTYQGQRMLQHVLAAEKSIELARQDGRGAGSRVEGDCRILCSDGIANYWMAQFLPRFYDRYPDIKLRIILDHELAASRQEAFDLRLHYFDPQSADHVTRPLGTVHFMLFASRDYLAKHGVPRSRDDLLSHRALDLAIYLTRAATWAAWFGDDIVKHISLFTNQSAFLARCVHDGAGIALMPTYMVLRDPDVVPLPLDINLSGNLYVSCSRDDLQKPAVKSTFRFVRETMFDARNMPWFAEKFAAPSEDWRRLYRAWMEQA